MKRWAILITIILFFPYLAHAVLPPDIIFNITSQVSQIVTAVSLAIGGAVFAIGPTLKNFFYRLRNMKLSTKILIGVLSLVSISFAVYFFVYTYGTGTYTPGSSMPRGPLISENSIGHTFYSDRFTIAYKNEKNEPFLIDLIINRKENDSGGFDHYYLGNIISGNQNGKFYKEGVSDNSAVLPTLFFTSYTKTKAEDHSSRDAYTFSFKLLGENYNIVTDELVADFITKNEIEYTSYTSSGNARISNSKGTFVAHIMHQGIYSNDYRPKIFFDDKGELRSETIQLILWDDENNFYLVDRSNVFEESPAYSSHLWALIKERDGTTKKAFGGEVHKISTRSNTNFTALIPNFKFKSINALLTHRFAKNQDKGWVEAKVELPSGTVSAYGLGYYHEYGLGNPLQ